MAQQQQPVMNRPVTLLQAMEDVEYQVANGDVARFQPLATGFHPLDDILNGGIRPGELLIVGGPYGVGKTIFGLQMARNVVRNNEKDWALYVCYEHDATHLLSRLLSLESAERGFEQDALTLRRLGELSCNGSNGGGLISTLRRMPRYAAVLQTVESYADRLLLVRASGRYSTPEQIREWVGEIDVSTNHRILLVIDYLQKIPVRGDLLLSESDATTYVTQALKELAVSSEIQVMAIAASDRAGLKSKRMRLVDLRGGSALQYEADIGLILNNKRDVVSRDHLVFNPIEAEEMRNWVVMSVEKNRAGRNAVDMEYLLDAAHFRFVPTGGFVRDRLVDEKVVLA
ncbi:MAG: hypothetical protein A2Y73_05730 [Chloroflexi bacterium RBG_13_56_8]|nr:MAG: hypothetical protein A2Y73_05730 [Chloroflexi bacterium RBG_13_56_8]